MDVRNDSPGWLVLWLEPLGEDRWLRPGERFRIRCDHADAFSVSSGIDDDDRAAGIENIVVWVEKGDCYAEVVDDSGTVVECGHQRPAEVERRWAAGAEEAARRAAGPGAPWQSLARCCPEGSLQDVERLEGTLQDMRRDHDDHARPRTTG